MRNISIIILLCISTSAFSQFYAKEFGVRGGYTAGLTFRVNIEENLSYEAKLGYRDNGAIFSMVRQQHIELSMNKNGNWKFLYGFGAHAGFYLTISYRILFREIYFGREMFTPVMGMDGFLGFEYQLVELPLSFGINFQPYMEISLKQLFGLNFWDIGLTAAYRF